MIIRGDHNVIPPVNGNVDPGSSGKVKGRRKSKTTDVVEISGSAKQRGAEKTAEVKSSEVLDDMKTGASRIRMQIHERIKSGFYESEQVVHQVAKRILDLFGF